MAEHAVDQSATVQGRAELGDVVGKVLRRHRRILHEGDGPAAALHVAEQTDGLLAHGPDAFDRLHGGERKDLLGALVAVLGNAQRQLRASAELALRDKRGRWSSALVIVIARDREAAETVTA